MLTTTRPLPKKMAESGRIRIGFKEANRSGTGTHPAKLQHFRMTSPNKPLLHCAANLFGGEVTAWEAEGAPTGQFELYTTVNAMDVLVPTASALSVSYEQWRGGGCVRRCTGETISHSPLEESLIGQPCLCPLDDHERADAAKTGKACARILRLNVILPDLPGLGLWRLETTGFYATAELLSALEMLQMGEHQIVEAALRLEWRTVKRYSNGKSTTLQFAVPVLWPKYTPRQLLASVDQRLLLMAPPAQIPQLAAGAQAADDIYGPGGGDRLRNGGNVARELPNEAGTPLPPSDETRQEEKQPTADPDAQQLIQQINDAWRAFGLTGTQIDNYWQKAETQECLRLRLMTPAHLRQRLGEVQRWIAKQPKRTPEPEPRDAPPAWRAELTALLATFDGDDALLKEMFDAVDDQYTPDSIGQAVLAQAQEAMAERVQGEV